MSAKTPEEVRNEQAQTAKAIEENIEPRGLSFEGRRAGNEFCSHDQNQMFHFLKKRRDRCKRDSEVRT
jgi:hypothetical protein